MQKYEVISCREEEKKRKNLDIHRLTTIEI